MTIASAEIIALKALGFLVNSPDALERFMALSGTGPEELRMRAAEPEFLAAVADFLLANEALLIGFCEAESMDARMLHMASHALSGGGE